MPLFEAVFSEVATALRYGARVKAGLSPGVGYVSGTDRDCAEACLWLAFEDRNERRYPQHFISLAFGSGARCDGRNGAERPDRAGQCAVGKNLRLYARGAARTDR